MATIPRASNERNASRMAMRLTPKRSARLCSLPILSPALSWPSNSALLYLRSDLSGKRLALDGRERRRVAAFRGAIFARDPVDKPAKRRSRRKFYYYNIFRRGHGRESSPVRSDASQISIRLLGRTSRFWAAMRNGAFGAP